ncbi:MAG: hypothetical protein WCI21_06180 [Alphaproteobacteria bacterium]
MRVLSVAVCVVWLGWSGSALAADEPIKIFGLDKLHWGMSAEDAVKALPALKPAGGGGLLTARGYVYGGCKFSLDGEVDGGRLVAITITSNTDDPDCPLNIKAMIDDAYGLPYDSNTLNDGITYGWKKGSTRIDSTQSPLLDYNHAKVEMWEEAPPPPPAKAA